VAAVLVFILGSGAISARGDNSSEASGMTMGVGVHLWAASDTDIDKSIDMASRANFKLIRWDIPWKAVEARKGELSIPQKWDYIVSKAKRRGIESMLILDYGNTLYDGGDKPISSESISAFARYAAFVASHFAGRVKYYEIWNEWNLDGGQTTPGKAKDYARLINATYPAIKKVTPDAIVLVGASSPAGYASLLNTTSGRSFFDQLLQIPNITAGDGISIHPYVYRTDDTANRTEAFRTLLQRLQAAVEGSPSFAGQPIYITEFGWSTAPGVKYAVSEEMQEKYIREAIAIAKDMGIKAFIVYELRDGKGNSDTLERGFGVVHWDWTVKPIFQTIKSIAQ
jgi:beta-glucosidase/6-phospho-beta-glucosidase/beta-galactosidase